MPPALNFAPLENAAAALTASAARYKKASERHGRPPAGRREERQRELIQSERQLPDPAGLKNRTWFRHLIYAPGFYTGYAVKTLPGVREGIEQKAYADVEPEVVRAAKAMERLTALIDEASERLGQPAGNVDSAFRPCRASRPAVGFLFPADRRLRQLVAELLRRSTEASDLASGASRAREGARPRHAGRSRLFEEDVSHAVDLTEHGRRPGGGHDGIRTGCRERSGQSGSDQATLSAAQASLSEMLKLPAAATLQGDVRTQVSGLHRGVQRVCDLAQGRVEAEVPDRVSVTRQDARRRRRRASASSRACPPARLLPRPIQRPGVWEPTVVEKLKEVRTHLNGFEKATGDPLSIVKEIERILDSAGAPADRRPWTPPSSPP